MYSSWWKRLKQLEALEVIQLLHGAWGVRILKQGGDHLLGPGGQPASRFDPERVPVRLPVPPEAVLPGSQKSDF